MTYVRDATVLRVIDADTLALRIDLGWRVHINGDIRLLRVSAPERNTEPGVVAAQFVRQLLAELGPDVTVTSHRRDPERSFARYLADITLSDGSDLADALIATGHGHRRA